MTTKMKQEKGVTIVALILMIILMLILVKASVTILAGSDGVVSESENAMSVAEENSLKEKIREDIKTEEIKAKMNGSLVTINIIESVINKPEYPTLTYDSYSEMIKLYKENGEIVDFIDLAFIKENNVLFESSSTDSTNGVAKLRDKYYSKLQTAINIASSNTKEKIVLLKDINESISIVAGKNIELDLGGKSIENNSNVIVNEGTIDIKNGDITSESGKAIYNKGTVTIDGCNLLSRTVNTVVNVSGSSLTVNGESTISSLSTANATISNQSNSTVIINNGTISAVTKEAVNNLAGAKLYVNGGTITSDSYRGVTNKGEVEVSGGIVKSTSNQGINNASGATIKITGGTIKSSSGNSINNNGTLNIQGGTIGNTESTSSTIYNNTSGAINITGGEIITNNSIAVYSKNIIEISGGKIISHSSNAINNYGGTVTISGDAEITDDGNSACIYNQQEGTILITGGTITEEIRHAIYLKNGTLRIEDGTITNNSESCGTIGKESGTLEIEGGTITNLAGGETIQE